MVTFVNVDFGGTELDKFIDAKQVAVLLGISVSAVHRLAARGTLPSVFLAGRAYWLREAVQRYIDDPKAQARSRKPREKGFDFGKKYTEVRP